jgi:nitrogen fixation NifU-like protein
VSKTPKTIRDHFLNPQNSGVLENPSGSAESRNEACGDVLRIDVEVIENVVTRIVFQARACSAVIGVASLITTAALKSNVADVQSLDIQSLIEAAGGVPPSKKHAGRVVRRALSDALEDASLS